MYAKVFSDILHGTLWDNPTARHVFMDLLVLADPHGVVDMTPQVIAAQTNMPLDVIMSALSALSAPDPKSRSPKDDGRRITLIDEHRDWGWVIVNFKERHALRDEDARRENNRRYQAERRARAKACQHPVSTLSAPVSTRQHSSAHADVDVDVDKEAPPPPTATEEKPKRKPDLHAEAFKAAFDAHFPEPYVWHQADFVQLAKWRKQYPDVPPERFAAVAAGCWGQGEYTPNASLSIKTFCPRWAQLAAKVQETEHGRSNANRANTPGFTPAKDPSNGYDPGQKIDA